MDERFFGYSIDLVAAALYMSPKTIQHYVLKCLNTEEAETHTENFRKTKNSFVMHPHAEFVIMEAVRLS